MDRQTDKYINSLGKLKKGDSVVGGWLGGCAECNFKYDRKGRLH